MMFISENMDVKKHEKVSFEEALNLTGFGKFNFLSFLLTSSIIAGMVFELFSVGYLVPASACELMTSSTQQGLMAAVPLIGVIATSHIWGYMADTRGRKNVLIFSMILTCICGAMSAFSPNWIFFSIFKFLSSSSVSGGYALSITLLSECNPAEKRFILLIFCGSVFFVSNGLMALITIPTIPLTFSYYVPVLGISFNSWRLLTLIFCVPSAISAIGLSLAYESPKFFMSVGREDEALEVLQAMFVINNNKSVDEYPVKSVTLDEDRHTSVSGGIWSSLLAQTSPLFKPPLLKNTILISVLFCMVYIGLNPYVTWLPFITDRFISSVNRGEEGLTFCQRIEASRLYAQNATSNEDWDVENACTLDKFAMLMTCVIGILLTTINTIIAFVVKYVGRKNFFIIIQFTSGVAGLLVNVTSSWIVGAVFFITFISGVLNFGFLATFSVDVFPTYVKAIAVCITLMVGRGSAVFGINVLKEMLNTNCEASFYVFSSITILGGIIGFLLPGSKKLKQENHQET